MKQRGADWIDVSSAGLSPQQKIAIGPGYQVPFAQAVKQATGIPTMAVGLITEAQQAEEIIERGQADWSRWHAPCSTTRAGAGTRRRSSARSVEAPPQYWRSQPSTQKELFGKTTFGAR